MSPMRSSIRGFAMSDTTMSPSVRRGARMLERDVKIEAPWRIGVRRVRRHRMAGVSAVLLLIIGVLALGAPIISQFDPSTIDLRARNQGPSLDHWFGTDRTGRDVYSRVVYAGRVSIMVGVVAVAISVAIAIVL